MAVYTDLDRQAIEGILAGYEVGRLVQTSPIAEGIENTNYFVDTDRGRYVLTIFERVDARDLPFFLAFMRHLAAKGIPCPDVVPRRDGALFFSYAGKHGCLITRLAGRTQKALNETQLVQAGAMLARMHLAAKDFSHQRPSPTDLAWLCATAEKIMPCLRQRWPAAEGLLREELAFQQQSPIERDEALPAGVIHGDVFVDNLLFEGDRLTGVIDFYYAHNAPFVLDLAIAANALALPEKGLSPEAVRTRLCALFSGYQDVSLLCLQERKRLGQALRLAALRFWVSRMFDACFPRKGALVQIKDPEEYREKLAFWRSKAAQAMILELVKGKG